jgi:hypothetical protein
MPRFLTGFARLSFHGRLFAPYAVACVICRTVEPRSQREKVDFVEVALIRGSTWGAILVLHSKTFRSSLLLHRIETGKVSAQCLMSDTESSLPSGEIRSRDGNNS